MCVRPDEAAAQIAEGDSGEDDGEDHAAAEDFLDGTLDDVAVEHLAFCIRDAAEHLVIEAEHAEDRGCDDEGRGDGEFGRADARGVCNQLGAGAVDDEGAEYAHDRQTHRRLSVEL